MATLRELWRVFKVAEKEAIRTGHWGACDKALRDCLELEAETRA